MRGLSSRRSRLYGKKMATGSAIVMWWRGSPNRDHCQAVNAPIRTAVLPAATATEDQRRRSFESPSQTSRGPMNITHGLATNPQRSRNPVPPAHTRRSPGRIRSERDSRNSQNAPKQ